MTANRIRTRPRDQKPLTARNPNACTIHQALKREYGVNVRVGGDIARERGPGGREWRLREDAKTVVATHDARQRVGSQTVTLDGPRLRSRAEQAEEARQARMAQAGRRDAGKPGERRGQEGPPASLRAPGRQGTRREKREPDAREQQVREAQAAEARERLRQAPARPPQPPDARGNTRQEPQDQPAARQARQPAAIEPPRPAPRWLRNPFAARPEPGRHPEPQPARARR